MSQQPQVEPTKRGRPAKITFKRFDKESDKVMTVESEARFHCWGNRPAKDKTTISTETVGICELPDGHIKLVMPERIQFQDRV